MPAPHSRHLCAGITFWDVLAVVAILVTIVAVVAAIMFPMFQKVREGRHRSCQSNLKQLGLAYVQYVQDSDEVYPVGVNTAGNGWAGKLYPYVKSTGVYRCPDDPAKSQVVVSYTENQNLPGKTLAVFNAPAATVELYEFTTPNCDPSTPETVSAVGLSAPRNSTRHDYAATPFGLNFLAVDGHVKYFTPAQISAGPGALTTRKITKMGPALLTFSVK